MKSLFLLLAVLLNAEGTRVIVKLSESTSVDTKLDDLRIRAEAVVEKINSSIFKGYTLDGLTDDEVKALEADEDVLYVQEDVKISVPPFDAGWPYVKTLSDDRVSPANAQTDCLFNWGLDRIDSRSGTDQQYEFNLTGSDIDIYIVDTGVYDLHLDFQGGRVSSDCFTAYDTFGEGCNDLVGHGTHVAGIAAGVCSGVAKEATIVTVKVFDAFGNGFVSDTIEGLGWIVDRHVERGSPPAVINMSLGSAFIQEFNDIVTQVIGAGIVVVAAAGNDNAANSCLRSPGSTPDAITVASSTSLDSRSAFSNVGTCVDIFAPGSSIYSSSHTEADIVVPKSGTSMACPHVAGAAALYLQANPRWTTAQVRNAMIADATGGVLSDTRDSPNLLLYTGNIARKPLCGCRLIQIFCVLLCLFGSNQ